VTARVLRARLRATRDAVADPQLARLLTVWGVWIATDWALLITVSVIALERGGPVAVGLVGAARVLPSAVLLAAGASAVADRVSRPRVLAVVQGVGCVMATALAGLATTDPALPLLLAVVGLGSAASAVLKPTLQAMLPQLVQSPGQLVVANSAWSTIEGLGTVLGPAGCALLLGVVGPVGVFVAVALVLLAGAVAGGSITTPFQPVRRAGRASWAAPLEGFRLIRERGIGVLFALFMAQTAMRGLVNVFVVIVATSGPDGSEARVGTLFAAIGVGGLLSALVGLAGDGGPGSRRGAARFGLGIALWGVPVVLIGVWSAPGVAWVALGVLGLGNGLADIYGYTLLNRLVPDHVAGRWWGAFHSAGAVTVTCGSLLAPVLVAGLGLSGAMVATGALLAVAPVVLWFRLRRVDDLADARAGDVDLLLASSLLAPLSLIALERLARVSQDLTVDPGTVVVVQGAVADGFYVVAEGELAVRQSVAGHDTDLRHLGPGAAFGEIALLQSGVRTASVVALTRSRLLAVAGEAFVAAVTGHRAADLLVRRTVADQLAGDLTRGNGGG
jgi:MFS family permease